MPNTRVTSTFLLVDRTQDRNVRVTAEYLLVDGQLPRDINTQVLTLLVDGRETSDIYTQSVYLIVDYVDAYYVADVWSLVSAFTCELQTSDIPRTLEQTWEITTEYTYDHLVRTEDVNWEIISEYTCERILIVDTTWDLVDGFTVLKTHRADVYAYMQEIINYLNLGNPTHPAPADEYLDFNDDGHITPLDVALVNIWYEYGEIYKYARPTWSITVTAYNWTNILASLSQTWSITSAYTVDTQKLGLTQQFILTDQWANPGTVNRTQPNTWSLSDSFIVQSSDTRLRDSLSFIESWDLEDKSRVLTTNWVLSDSWSLTNLTDTWALIDQFKLEAEHLFVNDTWALVSTFKAPYELTFADTWNLVDTYEDADYHTAISETWTLSETWDVTPLSVSWSDTMHRAVWLGGLDTQLIFGLTSWLSYVLDSVRTFSDIINWHETWQIELPGETVTTNWSMVSSFTNEYHWGELTDNINFVETWFQLVSKCDVVTGFTFTETYTGKLDAIRLIADNINLTGNFAAYSESVSWAGCLTLPAATLALTDSSETIVLRNAEFGNTLVIDTTRGVGSSRGGTPYVNHEAYWPTQDTYSYTITSLTDAQCDQLLTFIGRNIGAKISWRDHSGTLRFGYILNPAVEVRRYSKRRCSTEITLVEIPSERHTLDTTWNMSEAWLCL